VDDEPVWTEMRMHPPEKIKKNKSRLMEGEDERAEGREGGYTPAPRSLYVFVFVFGLLWHRRGWMDEITHVNFAHGGTRPHNCS
jgi:hypothetical protein